MSRLRVGEPQFEFLGLNSLDPLDLSNGVFKVWVFAIAMFVDFGI